MTIELPDAGILSAALRAIQDLHLPKPLPPWGAFAALQVVLGNTPLEDAANAVGVSPEALIHEAQAWAYAASQQVTDD
jgi:hypothetical protein